MSSETVSIIASSPDLETNLDLTDNFPTGEVQIKLVDNQFFILTSPHYKLFNYHFLKVNIHDLYLNWLEDDNGLILFMGQVTSNQTEIQGLTGWLQLTGLKSLICSWLNPDDSFYRREIIVKERLPFPSFIHYGPLTYVPLTKVLTTFGYQSLSMEPANRILANGAGNLVINQDISSYFPGGVKLVVDDGDRFIFTGLQDDKYYLAAIYNEILISGPESERKLILSSPVSNIPGLTELSSFSVWLSGISSLTCYLTDSETGFTVALSQLKSYEYGSRKLITALMEINTDIEEVYYEYRGYEDFAYCGPEWWK